MSTKATIAYGENFHLYRECFDDDNNVYLQLDKVDYEVVHMENCNSVTVKIPLAVWEAIRKHEGK